MIGKRCACLLAALCLLFTLFACGREKRDGLFVEVLDVGQSDCTLITVGDAALMIDAGTVAERDAVRGCLRQRGIERLDYLLLTHPHEDHIGNARMLIESDTVGALILSPMYSEDTTYRMILDAAEAKNIPCHTAVSGNLYFIGDAVLEILFADAEAKEVNDGSVIARVSYGETSVLFTGDAEEAAERALLAAVPAEKLACDLLKAGHHGSSTSSCEELLRAASPDHVAISCGRDNDYGFPHAALLDRLEKAGTEWHRTDEEGVLCYFSDGYGVTYKGE